MTDSHIYHLRASSGEYDKLLVNLQNMKKHALFGLEYNVDFERHPKNGFRKLAGNEKKGIFSTWVFGEIADRSLGTIHQASGNHYLGTHPVRLLSLAFRLWCT